MSNIQKNNQLINDILKSAEKNIAEKWPIKIDEIGYELAREMSVFHLQRS